MKVEPKIRCKRSIGILATLGLAFTLTTTADLFQTGAGTAFDAGIFGLGIIPLEGVQLPGATLGTDTIVARTQAGPPDGGSSVIEIELVAMHLTSIGPVDLSPLGGPFIGVFADLHVTVDASDRFYDQGNAFPDGLGSGPSIFNLPVPDAPLPPSIGMMRIDHDGPGAHSGGGFSSCFGTPTDEITGNCQGPTQVGLGSIGGGIHADAIFVIPGGDPANPLDLIINVPAPQISLGSTGTFLHGARSVLFPSGNFIVETIIHTGPHPVDPIAPVGGLPLFGPIGTVLLAGALGIGALRRLRA
jgi:hypothetical protein